MDIFALLSNISDTKKPHTLNKGDDFSQMMILKWLSFASPLYCSLLNDIVNTKYQSFTGDNQMLFDYLRVILPKKKLGKINYIKKQPAPAVNDTTNNLIHSLSSGLQISKREAKELMDSFPELQKNYIEK